MYKDKKIGIVILNYNDSNTTIKLCKLIENYQIIDNIVIVDNKSTDDSFDKLSTLKNDKVVLVQCDENGGYSSGNNFGAFYLINNYNTDIIVIANPDVEFNESFLTRSSDILISRGFQGVSGIMMNIDGSIGTKNNRINSYFYDLIDCTLVMRRLFHPKTLKISDTETIIETEFLYGSLFLIDAAFFRKIGGFDENVFLYCEERILGERFKRNNGKMAIITSITYKHMHSITINKSLKKLNQLKQLFKSRLYYWNQYKQISTLKILILKIFMKYGVLIRKIIYR